MTQRASESLVAVLIRIGLLLALAILLMAENAQAQSAPAHFPHLSRLQWHFPTGGTRTSRKSVAVDTLR